VLIFFKENYKDNKKVVDLAAKLTALNVIDIEVCEFSYIKEGLDSSGLLPFITAVPVGPKELGRLIEDENVVTFDPY
jgi:hypothetical protein